MSDATESQTPATRGPVSLTALQCELRALFENRPTNRALAEVLQRIGSRLGAAYAAVHARIGVHLLSEEWDRDEHEAPTDSDTREQVNAQLWETISSEESRCTRLEGASESSVVLTAVMYDADVEPSGGAALVVHDCDRARAQQLLAHLEGVLGYLSLLIGGAATKKQTVAERREIKPTAAAEHPVQLAFAIAAEIENRYGFDLTAVGFATGSRVEVVAISGVEEVRASNPGVALIRGAMEECLDRGEAVVHGGGNTEEDDCRLHAQWSATLQGNPVASFPLEVLDEVVAVISMSQGAGTQLTRDQVVIIAEETSGYAALVPLSRAAARSLPQHIADSTRQAVRRVTGRGKRKTAILGALALFLIGWLAFGKMQYTFTVPAVVQAADRRTISCPRDGVLAELFVRPGDRVREGQLLASLDSNDDFLRRAELRAEIDSLEALVDHALAERNAGQLRVHEARRRSLLAQLAIVDSNIGQAQIRAPQDGLILEGDLREQLGGRLKMGEPLFELARYDRAAVVLQVPERLVLAAHDCLSAEFAPAARPDESFPLEGLRIAPASTIIDDRNVFLGEAVVPMNLEMIPPGMEGTTQLDAGPRSAWWVLTHRVTDWLHLNFWL